MNNATMEREASSLLDEFAKAIEGLQNDWPSTQQAIVYQQTTYTPAQLIAKLQAAVAPIQAVPDARSALKTAMANRLVALPEAIALVNGFYAILPQYLPPGADVAKFGAKPKKARQPQTAEQKAAANAKRAATRAARHIMGKNQRKAIQAPAQTTAQTPAQTPGH
jgi:hypothetical protein